MAKRYFMMPLLLCLVFASSCSTKGQIHEAFQPGALWLDNNGIHINAHGGGILFHEGKYYWFGEHKGEHSSNAFVGITCYSSADLYNWQYEGVALPVENDTASDITSGSVIERPKVIYNQKTGKFVMYFHLELKGQGYSAARVGVAVSDNITGPYKYLKSYRPNAGRFPENMTEAQRKATATLADFEEWWTPEWYKAVEDGLFVRRDFEGGQMSRDMTLFVDDDGKAYHIYSSEENLTLHIAELSDDYLTHTGKYIRMAPAGHNEAPAIFKKDDKYFMITSGCTGWAPNEARMFSADSIWGPWTQHPNPCVGEGAELTFHSQSTYIQPVMGKKDAFIFMADRWTPKMPIDARYIWLPIQFENGLPVLKWMDKWDLSFFETFEIGNNTFLLNGEPFVIKAAEIHYPRIPVEYWEHRIKMCKALGMNTICLYVFWNLHEPEEGKFDFSENKDVAAFCKLAQKHGMYVILRPGPYVCAEWEMGGLPWWLLKKKDIQLRKQDPYFMEKVRIFMAEVGKQLSDLQLANGGNILMVQVENEYGAYGIDKPYVSEVRDIVRASFDKVPLFQCDWSSNFENNALDDLLWTINFGTGANIDNEFKRLKELRPETPLMCSEFWSGWFDHWGAPHETRSAEELVAGMKEMLDKNISFSLYMTHGGTSFGHWAGSNFPGYVPDCTSYDYDAPINESGNVTPKYFKVRELLASYLPEGETLPDIPDSIPAIDIPVISFDEAAPIFENLPEPKTSENIQSMEFFNQGWGSILYRTALKKSDIRQTLKITNAHDYALVFIDGQRIGILNRLKEENSLFIPPVREGAVLDIFVEAMGRRNFGAGVIDYKGITEKVEVISEQSTTELMNWEVYCFPVDYSFAKNQKYHKISKMPNSPAYYKATFNLDKTGDTFLNMMNWKKGMVYVNGYNIGRFWEIGPQQTLYMPGCWLKKGKNEIIIMDLIGTEDRTVTGQRQPILDILRGLS